MDAIDVIFTILLNALPIGILIIPLFFIRKRMIGKLYLRIVCGLIVFYLIYWILPIIFQMGEQPSKLVVNKGQEGDVALGLRYIAAHIGALCALYAFYPLVTLPFIFFVSPFISMLFLWNHLRKQEGTIKENLKKLTYEYDESPYNKIINGIKKNDWSREKEILKLMIILLPISLYLLQVIIDISNLQTISLTTGETSLGWFIEILFVYLAIFIFSIELLFSSKIALKGRVFGENIRKQTYRSLFTVGAPISILSLILFIIQYTSSIFIVIYFFAYFIMASIIFVLFLKVFEPISIMIFVKLIDWWKNKDIKTNNFDKRNWTFGLIFSSLAVFIFLMLNTFIFVPIFSLFREDQSVIVESAKFEFNNPSLQNSLRFDLLIIFSLVVLVVVPIIITSLLLVYSLKYIKSFFIAILTFVPIIILLSIVLIIFGANPLINFAPEEYWLTGKISYTDVFGFRFYTSRTAAFDANLFPKGQITLLGILAIPYLFTRYIFNIIIWSLMISYYKKEFKVKNIPIEEKLVERTIFSPIKNFLTYEDYVAEDAQYLITRNQNIIVEGSEQKREEIIDLLNSLENDKLLANLKPKDEVKLEKFYYVIKFLYSNKQINVWQTEFSFIFEKVEKQALYVIYDDGRDVFNHQFTEESLHDPGLISGMFTAITSFIKETTKSTQLLKTIDHGDITILIEYGQFTFVALFSKGNSAEVRAQLKTFIKRFETKHAGVLPDWNGMLKHFKEDNLLIEEIFKEE